MTEATPKVIAAATDGACSGNPGPGGWGALFRLEDGKVEELGGFESSTTNNRMELKAALSLLERLKDFSCYPGLKIRTDSKYLIDGFSKWMPSWKRKGWRTASGKPVLNQDLWQALDRARLSNVSLAYVKGHSGDSDNERVDQIAVSFSKGFSLDLKSEIKDLKLGNIGNQDGFDNDAAPDYLQKLFSRLELADCIARKGYALTSFELADLIGEPQIKHHDKKAAWRWRNWLVEPLDHGLWKLNYVKSVEMKSEDKKNE